MFGRSIPIVALIGALSALAWPGSFTTLNQTKSTSTGSIWSTSDGTKVNPLGPQKRPSVLIFLLTDCPIANAFAPELNRIISAYGSKVAISAVYVDEGLTAKAAKVHAQDYGLKCTIVLDPSQSLARRMGAFTSPEAVVVNPSGKIVYRGRIDDRFVDYGKSRPQPKRRDLRVALDEVLEGRPVSVPRTKAIGCILRIEGKS